VFHQKGNKQSPSKIKKWGRNNGPKCILRKKDTYNPNNPPHHSKQTMSDRQAESDFDAQEEGGTTKEKKSSGDS